MFYTFSAIFIGTGLTLFAIKVHKGEMLDIEFASGTSVEFELKQPMDIKDVRGLIDNVARQRQHELPGPSVYAVGTNGLGYEVVTANPIAAEVRKGVLDALGERLKTDLPSTFDGYDQAASTQLGKAILPIDTSQTQIPGAPAEMVANHVGGAAIVLNNLNPPLKPSEIKARVDRMRMQAQPGQATVPYREFDVATETGRDEATNSAVILISDPALPHDQDAAKWELELVTPMWKMVTEAIHSEAKLQKVSNFDAQVAGETAREAMLALAMSIAGIMAYIWVRFGNLKYGTATVVALLHDVVFTVAAIGFSHYVVELPAIGHFFSNVLLIEPFRINLTIIASILTVMGYSMNDTVVVFDRIRENRGKFGATSRQVINDSINQTLSRTLLTSGCTLVTVTTMYFLGGPGIHGFTYCLLLGILVGTYSSVAIAAPILLLGKHEDGGPGSTDIARKSQPVGQLQRA